MKVLDPNSHMNIVNIPTDQITPNEYNPNKMEKIKRDALQTSITEDGFLQPVLVRKVGDAYVIVDGEHRYTILKDMGSPEIPCIVVDVDDVTAKAFTINMNNLRGDSDRLKLAEVIKELRTRYSIEELEERLGFTTKEIKSFEELVNFDFDAFHDESDKFAGEAIAANKEEEINPMNDATREFIIPVNVVEEDLVRTALATKPNMTKEQAMTQLCNEFLTQ
jgi:ParB/RepB/Spo0J family partition protein